MERVEGEREVRNILVLITHTHTHTHTHSLDILVPRSNEYWPKHDGKVPNGHLILRLITAHFG